MEPSGLRISAKRRRILVPAGPLAFSLTRPAKFWPMSKTETPPGSGVIICGATAATTRTGTSIWLVTALGGASATTAGRSAGIGEARLAPPRLFQTGIVGFAA